MADILTNVKMEFQTAPTKTIVAWGKMLSVLVSAAVMFVVWLYNHSNIILIISLFLLLLFIIILSYSLIIHSKNKEIQSLKKQIVQKEQNKLENKSLQDNQFSWEDIEIGVKVLKQNIINSGYIPTLMVGIGRGGAIISSLLSGNLISAKHIPFIALDRKYEEKDGMRCASVFDDVSFTKDLDRVLLIAGDLVTGKTADVFIKFLKTQGAKEIRFLTYVKATSTNKIPDYLFIESDNIKHKFPWMFSDEYNRDSRI
jgi:probable phosphoglycerate mutase